tara:strand:- start:38 stop:502 length:465 start_codon:yes stop_codon:yes gene_type:complete
MAMTPPQSGMMAPAMAQEPMQAPQQPMQAPMKQSMGLNISGEQFTKVLNTLDQSDIEALDTHLTPVIKNTITKLLGAEVGAILKDLGPDEPTVNIPVSVIASSFPADTIEESIEIMKADMASKSKNIPSPPRGGLGGEPMKDSPQTDVPPMLMA